VTVLPKSSSPARIEENSAVFDFNLTQEEMKVIGSYNRPDGRLILPNFGDTGKPRDAGHPHFPFNIDF
jgi:diketogulonate reductase-like aldo/keto reductase